MKTKKLFPETAVRFLSAAGLIVAGMFMIASCSKEEISNPIALKADDQLALRTDLPVISMKQTGCEAGNCAEFDFQAYEDGTVIYNGFSNVSQTGQVEFRVEEGLVRSLAEFAYANRFFRFKDSYPAAAGNSQVSTFCRFNQLKKTISDFGVEVPDNLKMIKQTFLDKLGITPLIAPPSSGEQPVISIRHTDATGNFPAYNVTLYADGRMVYEGVRNVATIGTVENTVPSEVVHELINFARDNGFLDMQDEYPVSGDEQRTQTIILIDDILKSVVDYSIDIPENLVMIKGNIEDKLGIRELTGF